MMGVETWGLSAIASEVGEWLEGLDEDSDEGSLKEAEQELAYEARNDREPHEKVESTDMEAMRSFLTGLESQKAQWELEHSMALGAQEEEPDDPGKLLTRLSLEDIIELHKSLAAVPHHQSQLSRSLTTGVQTLAKWQEQHCQCFVMLKRFCSHLRRRRFFRFFFWMAIIANIVLIVLVANAEVDEMTRDDSAGPSASNEAIFDFSDLADRIFLVLYTIEITVRSLGVKETAELFDGFLIADVVLVISQCVDLALTEARDSSGDNPLVSLRAVRLFRVVRIVKVLRLMETARPFRVLIRALRSCFIDLFWVVAFLFIFNYAAAAFFTQTVGWISDTPEVAELNYESRENATNYSFFFNDTIRSTVTISGISLNGFAFGSDLMEGSLQNDDWSVTAKIFLVFYVCVIIFWHLDITRGVFISDLFQSATADSSFVSQERTQLSEQHMVDLKEDVWKHARLLQQHDGKLSLEGFTQAILRSKHNSILRITASSIQTIYEPLKVNDIDRVDIDELLIALFKTTCPSYDASMMHIDAMTLRTSDDVATLLRRYKQLLQTMTHQRYEMNFMSIQQVATLGKLVDKLANQLEERIAEGWGDMRASPKTAFVQRLQSVSGGAYMDYTGSMMSGQYSSGSQGTSAPSVAFRPSMRRASSRVSSMMQRESSDPWSQLDARQAAMPTVKQVVNRLEKKFGFRSKLQTIRANILQDVDQLHSGELLDLPSSTTNISIRTKRAKVFHDILQTEAMPWLRDRLHPVYQQAAVVPHLNLPERGEGSQAPPTASRNSDFMGDGTARSTSRTSRPPTSSRQEPSLLSDDPSSPSSPPLSSNPSPRVAKAKARTSSRRSVAHIGNPLPRQMGEAPKFSPKDHLHPAGVGFVASGLARALQPARGSHMGYWQPLNSHRASTHRRLELNSDIPVYEAPAARTRMGSPQPRVRADDGWDFIEEESAVDSLDSSDEDQADPSMNMEFVGEDDDEEGGIVDVDELDPAARDTTARCMSVFADLEWDNVRIEV